MLDVAVVGSGPCALALLARLAAPPGLVDDSADFLWGFDSETQSLHDTIRGLQALKPSTMPGASHRPSLHGRVKVFDQSGAWMGKWNHLFEALGIQHLRSPHVAHPCPTHTLALLAHGAQVKTMDTKPKEAFADFCQLQYSGCHRAPSVPLFGSLCAHLRTTLDLDALLEQATILAVEPVYAHDTTKTTVAYFRLTLQRANGEREVVEAKTVVVATGSTSCPRLPEWWPSLLESPCRRYPPHALRHAWALPQDLCASAAAPKPLQSGERILVVGGGLTAAQLSVLAADQGQGHVCMASRRGMVTKQFDFEHAWMDRKQRPRLLRQFLQAATPEERLRLIQEARGQSSIPLEALAMLRARHDRIDVRQHTEVAAFPPPQWDAQAQAWCVVLESLDSKGKVTREACVFDRIWAATGSDVCLEQHPLLGPFCEHRPLDRCGDFPCLTPDLAWDAGCELYVLGMPAALVLGPDAGNLMGARTGAGRVAHVLQERLCAAEKKGDADVEARVHQAKKDVASLAFKYDRRRECVRSAGLTRGRGAADGGGDEQEQRKTKNRGWCARKGKNNRRSCC